MSNVEPTKRSSGVPPLPPEVWEALAQESPEEQALLAEVWELSGRALRAEPSEATFQQLGTQVWANLEAALPTPATTPTPATSLRRAEPARPSLRLIQPRLLSWMAVAACIVVLLGVGFLLYQRPITVTNPRGGAIAAVTLPDGSVVELNSESSLSYARTFGHEGRMVHLEGEAFFNVVSGDTPFQVETFNGAVTVVGTEFNVRAREDDVTPATKVTVAEGIVRVMPRQDDKDAVILEAGQSARVLSETASPERLSDDDAQYALAWRTGGFKFANQPLGTITREIERRFGVEIRIADEDLIDSPASYFKEPPLAVDSVIIDICEYNGCSFREISGGYEIYRP